MAGAVLPLVPAWCCGDEDGLIELGLDLFKFQRAVVKGRRQPEAIFHQCFFTGIVAAVHSPHLRQRNMALVDKQQKILREIVQQRGGHTAWRPAGQHGRIVLDALAHPHFIEHLDIIVCPLGDALRLNELALGGKLPYLGVTLCTDLLQRSSFFSALTI